MKKMMTIIDEENNIEEVEVLNILYLDVTENYYTLEDDVKVFLISIPKENRSFLWQLFIFNEIFQYSNLFAVLISKLKQKTKETWNSIEADRFSMVYNCCLKLRRQDLLKN